jgi:hypothetical protein
MSERQTHALVSNAMQEKKIALRFPDGMFVDGATPGVLAYSVKEHRLTHIAYDGRHYVVTRKLPATLVAGAPPAEQVWTLAEASVPIGFDPTKFQVPEFN